MSLTVSVGNLQFAVWDVAGNALASPKVFGIVDGGNTNSGTYETIRVPGINLKESFVAGMNKYQPTISGKYTVDTKKLLLN
jgi:hypothetical protein